MVKDCSLSPAYNLSPTISDLEDALMVDSKGSGDKNEQIVSEIQNEQDSDKFEAESSKSLKSCLRKSGKK